MIAANAHCALCHGASTLVSRLQNHSEVRFDTDSAQILETSGREEENLDRHYHPPFNITISASALPTVELEKRAECRSLFCHDRCIGPVDRAWEKGTIGQTDLPTDKKGPQPFSNEVDISISFPRHRGRLCSLLTMLFGW